jgi:hypothetical protein
LSPSFSGDCEYTDVPSKVAEFSMKHLLREGFEELDVVESEVLDDSVQFLGLGRELVRGGKPELFFAAHTHLTEREFLIKHNKAIDRWEFCRRGAGWVFWDFGTEALSQRPDDQQKHMLRTTFDNLITAHGPRMSLPLVTNIALWMGTKLGSDWFGAGTDDAA